MKIWWYIFILILFIITIHFLIYFTPKSINDYIVKNNISYISLNKLLEKVNNGDIILLSGNEFGEKSIKFYTNSMFSHIGIIIKDLDPVSNLEIPYLWEADLGQGYRQGPRVIKLEDKLKRWKGSRFGVWKSIKGKITKDQLLSIVAKYVSMDMDQNMICWLFSSFPTSFLFKYFKDPKKIFCSELVALTLQDLDVMKKERNPAYYTPQDFFLDRLPLNNFEYFSPTYFEF